MGKVHQEMRSNVPTDVTGLKMFRYRIIIPTGSAIHAFFTKTRAEADKDARAWAKRRNATKLTRLKEEK